MDGNANPLISDSSTSTEIKRQDLQKMLLKSLIMGKKREQPIFTTKAHVFQIDPKTRKNWLPSSQSAVPVSFFYDSTRSTYRIISVEGTKAIINSTISPNMQFTKTSQKFGQWADSRANTVYGLGFSSEHELTKFVDKFKEVKEATRIAYHKAHHGGVPPPPSGTSPINGVGGHQHSPKHHPHAHTHHQHTNSTPTSSSPASSTTGTSTTLVNDVPHSHSHSRSHSASSSPAHLPKHPHTHAHPHAHGHPHPHPPGEGGSLPNSPSISSTSPTPTHANDTTAHLKYENDRLKIALAQSSSNAKKWEVELQTLKNNNARLTTALQESTQNVEEWKKQLNAYKDECYSLRQQKQKMTPNDNNETSPAPADTTSGGLGALRAKVEQLERENQSKMQEINVLTSKIEKLTMDNTSSTNAKKDSIKDIESDISVLHKEMSTIEVTMSRLSTLEHEVGDIHKVLVDKLRHLHTIQDRIVGHITTGTQQPQPPAND